MDLTVEFLNTVSMAPDQSRTLDGIDCGLIAGQLQLYPSTFVLVNETLMNDGTLNETGLRNLQALNHVVQDASVPYGIHYGTMTKDVEFQVCVVSEGKSLVGGTVIPLVATGEVQFL